MSLYLNADQIYLFIFKKCFYLHLDYPCVGKRECLKHCKYDEKYDGGFCNDEEYCLCYINEPSHTTEEPPACKGKCIWKRIRDFIF